MIYTDNVVRSLRKIGYTADADQRERDGEWLLSVSRRAILSETSKHLSLHSMHFYFAEFVNILKEVGRVWAAQLLVRGVDMHDLEKQVSCILSPADNPNYYVDRYFGNDLPNQYCIASFEQADEMLSKMGRNKEKNSYLEVKDKAMQTEVINKLSKAYNQLIKETFLSKDTTSLDTFIDVMIYNSDKKIVWLNDPKHKYICTLIKVFLGFSSIYKYPGILKINQGRSYAGFIQNHFLNEKFEPLEFKTNCHEIGSRDKDTFERILIAIYGYVKYFKQ